MFIKDDRIYGASSSSSTILILCSHRKSPVLSEKKMLGPILGGKGKRMLRKGHRGDYSAIVFGV